jgi:hypothetical protein
VRARRKWKWYSKEVEVKWKDNKVYCYVMVSCLRVRLFASP